MNKQSMKDVINLIENKFKEQESWFLKREKVSLADICIQEDLRVKTKWVIEMLEEELDKIQDEEVEKEKVEGGNITLSDKQLNDIIIGTYGDQVFGPHAQKKYKPVKITIIDEVGCNHEAFTFLDSSIPPSIALKNKIKENHFLTVLYHDEEDGKNKVMLRNTNNIRSIIISE